MNRPNRWSSHALLLQRHADAPDDAAEDLAPRRLRVQDPAAGDRVDDPGDADRAEAPRRPSPRRTPPSACSGVVLCLTSGSGAAVSSASMRVDPAGSHRLGDGDGPRTDRAASGSGRRRRSTSSSAASASGEPSIFAGKLEQLLAHLVAGGLDRRADRGGRQRAALDRRLRQRRIAELERHVLQRQARASRRRSGS